MIGIIAGLALALSGQPSAAPRVTYEVCIASSGLGAGADVYHSDIFEAGDQRAHEAEFTAALRSANLPNGGVSCRQTTDLAGLQTYVSRLAGDPDCATCAARNDVPIHWKPKDPLAELLGDNSRPKSPTRPEARPELPALSADVVARAGVEAEARHDAELQARMAEFRAQNLADAKAAADRRAAEDADYAAQVARSKASQEAYERSLQAGRAAEADYRAAQAAFQRERAAAKAAADKYEADKVEYDRKYPPK